MVPTTLVSLGELQEHSGERTVSLCCMAGSGLPTSVVPCMELAQSWWSEQVLRQGGRGREPPLTLLESLVGTRMSHQPRKLVLVEEAPAVGPGLVWAAESLL